MITPAQSRAGRALLDWSQMQLAETSHLSESSIRNFEKGRSMPTHNNLAAIRHALEEAGVIFIAENGEGPGVRLKKATPKNPAWTGPNLSGAMRLEHQSPDVVNHQVIKALGRDDVTMVLFYTKIRDRRTAPCAHRVCILVLTAERPMLFDQGENHLADVGSPRRRAEVEEMVAEALHRHPEKTFLIPEKLLSLQCNGPAPQAVAELLKLDRVRLTAFSQLYETARFMDPDVP